ncbi:hypothetical protein KAI32_02350 [Candidatus Pacearchaeota archaeon]|nr:hypothetical protein [Candidatus Pacearchaeota archaeon]
MIKNNGRFIIKFEEQDKEFVENLDWEKLNEGYDKAKNFFEYEGEISPIRINLIYSPEEYLFFSGYLKHENWMSACAGYHNTIYIFAPSVIEKYTIHKKEEILKTLIHEITHFFYGYSAMKKSMAKLSLWDEGIAEYIAEQNNNKEIDFEISTLSNFTDNPSKNYILGYRLIENIMNYFGDGGNKKIIEFLTKVVYAKSEEDLFSKFEEVFSMDIKTLMELKGGIKK